MFGIFKNLETKVTVNHKDGSHDEIVGTCNSGKIFIEYAKNKNVKISENDSLIVHNKNGVDETFIVIEPSFYDNVFGTPAHYQCKVMHLSEFERKQSAKGHINIQGFQGNGNIINLGNNNQNVINDNTIFDKMIECMNQIEGINNKDAIIAAIKEMKASANNKNSFLEKYTKFVSLVGTHITIFQPFLPMLSKFFG